MSSQIIYSSVLEVDKLVKLFQNDPDTELELRLGKLTRENKMYKFSPEVSRQKFTEIIALLDTYGEWTQIEDWKIISDWYYNNVTYDGVFYPLLRASMSGDSKRMKWIAKTKVDNVDMECKERGFVIRASLKTEKTMDISMLAKEPDYLRIKKRKSYILDNLFKYDFTITREGKGEKQDVVMANPKYEVEIELLHNTKEEAKYETSKNLSASLLEKMIDLIGRESRYSLTVVSQVRSKG